MRQQVKYIVQTIPVLLASTVWFMPLIPALLCAYAAHMIPRQTYEHSQSVYLTIATLMLTIGAILLLGCMMNASSSSSVVIRMSPDALRTTLTAGVMIFAAGLACLGTRQLSVRAAIWTGAITLAAGAVLITMGMRAQEFGPGMQAGLGLSVHGLLSLFISPFRYSYLNEPERLYAPPMIRRPVRARPDRSAPTRRATTHAALPPETALMSSAKLRRDALNQRGATRP